MPFGLKMNSLALQERRSLCGTLGRRGPWLRCTHSHTVCSGKRMGKSAHRQHARQLPQDGTLGGCCYAVTISAAFPIPSRRMVPG
jgi:hypothetical protein